MGGGVVVDFQRVTMTSPPQIIIIAGPNSAGESTSAVLANRFAPVYTNPFDVTVNGTSWP